MIKIVNKKITSKISLILANLFPIFAVIFLDWKIQDILILYWLENIVIGFFNILRMLTVKTQMQWHYRLPLINFFIAHFYGFVLGHGIFIITIARSLSTIGNFQFQAMDKVNGIELLTPHLTGLMFLFFSHGISFFDNFILKREREKTNLGILFTIPYKRIIVMHITIIIGTFTSTILGQSAGLIIALITTKIIVDLMSHNKEHSILKSNNIKELTNFSLLLKDNKQRIVNYKVVKLISSLTFLITYLISIFLMIIFLSMFSQAFLAFL